MHLKGFGQNGQILKLEGVKKATSFEEVLGLMKGIVSVDRKIDVLRTQIRIRMQETILPISSLPRLYGVSPAATVCRKQVLASKLHPPSNMQKSDLCTKKFDPLREKHMKSTKDLITPAQNLMGVAKSKVNVTSEYKRLTDAVRNLLAMENSTDFANNSTFRGNILGGGSLYGPNREKLHTVAETILISNGYLLDKPQKSLHRLEKETGISRILLSKINNLLPKIFSSLIHRHQKKTPYLNRIDIKHFFDWCHDEDNKLFNCSVLYKKTGCLVWADPRFQNRGNCNRGQGMHATFLYTFQRMHFR